MALTPEQSAEVQAAMSKLRSMGCAVCIFVPEDVESAAEAAETAITEQAAAGWLLDNRKWLEDGMSTWGNHYIADNLSDTAS
jgi:hypothetical protein